MTPALPCGLLPTRACDRADTNKLFDGLAINERWHVRNPEGAVQSVATSDEATLPKKRFAGTLTGDKDRPGYPIIPLTGSLAEPIEIGAADLPKPEGVDLDALHSAIRTRIEKIVDTLVDVDFKPEIDKMNFFIRGAARLGARKVGAQILSDKAITLVDGAINDLKEAFK